MAIQDQELQKLIERLKRSIEDSKKVIKESQSLLRDIREQRERRAKDEKQKP